MDATFTRGKNKGKNVLLFIAEAENDGLLLEFFHKGLVTPNNLSATVENKESKLFGVNVPWNIYMYLNHNKELVEKTTLLITSDLLKAKSPSTHSMDGNVNCFFVLFLAGCFDVVANLVTRKLITTDMLHWKMTLKNLKEQ